jgi:hypothetical protein
MRDCLCAAPFLFFVRLKRTQDDSEDVDEVSFRSDDEIPAMPALPKGEDQETIAIIEKSTFQQTLKAHLRTYVSMEAYYFRCALEKVHSLDWPDLAARPVVTSALDDTFFLFKKVLARTLATADAPTVTATCAALRTTLERDWAHVFRKRMDLASPDMQLQSSYRAEDQKRERDARAAYLAYLNNLELGSDYLRRLTQNVQVDGTVANAFFRPEELAEATQALTHLASVDETFKATLRVRLLSYRPAVLIRLLERHRPDVQCARPPQDPPADPRMLQGRLLHAGRGLVRGSDRKRRSPKALLQGLG